MPDLEDLLRGAADAIQINPVPDFDVLARSARHRVQRRRAAAISASAALVVGAVLVSQIGGPVTRKAPVAAGPCVTHDSSNAGDTFAAIPTTGTEHLDLAVGDTLTVGWLTCGEAGDLTSSDPQDGTSDHLAGPGGGLRVRTQGVASARFQAFRSGDLTLTGAGDRGSTGTLQITIGQQVEPVGATTPSPYPGPFGDHGLVDFCLSPDAVDADGRVTRPVGLGPGTSLVPAGDVVSKYTAAATLDRYRSHGVGAHPDGHPQAVFGLYTDVTSAPFPKDAPGWVVVTCDSSLSPRGGSAGFNPNPAPAPGTADHPGGAFLGERVYPYNENGVALYESDTAYPDAALRAEQLFEVPFTRSHEDATNRQIALTYSSDDRCSTFDHLDVQEAAQDSTVYVRIWLRLLPGRTASCAGARDQHQAVVGLRYPLAARLLVRGTTPR